MVADPCLQALADAFEVNRHIRELYLGSNNLGAEGAKAIGNDPSEIFQQGLEV